MTKTLKNNLTALQRFILHFSESHYVDVLYFFAIFFLNYYLDIILIHESSLVLTLLSMDVKVNFGQNTFI